MARAQLLPVDRTAAGQTAGPSDPEKAGFSRSQAVTARETEGRIPCNHAGQRLVMRWAVLG